MEWFNEKAFRFNTGRYYAPEGQIVEGEIVESVEADKGMVHRVRFADQTRKVFGLIVVVGEVTQQKIMSEYDAGRYEGIGVFRVEVQTNE
jgi:hypothetical protein